MQRQAVSQATLDTSTATRDNAQASLLQAQVNTKIAAVNYGYTHVAAPFDGVVSAHLVSVGELVGASSPTQLATIVALDPIWVNFNVNEQDVLRIRAEARRRGHDGGRSPAIADRGRIANRDRLSAQGQARLCRRDAQPVDRHASGARRAAQFRPRAAAGVFVRVRVPIDQEQNALFVPDVALGSDQAGRYLLVVNGENVVEQRKVRTGPLQDEAFASSRRASSLTIASSPPGCCARSPARRSIRN